MNIEWPDIVQVQHYIRKAKGYPDYDDIPKNYIAECITHCPMCWEYESYIEACKYYFELLDFEPTDGTLSGGVGV